MNHCEFIVMERQCLLAIRLMSQVILMSEYFKVIIFISSCQKKKKKGYIYAQLSFDYLASENTFSKPCF